MSSLLNDLKPKVAMSAPMNLTRAQVDECICEALGRRGFVVESMQPTVYGGDTHGDPRFGGYTVVVAIESAKPVAR